MYIGIVVGTVVATQKADGLTGIKLLVVQPVNDDWTPRGDLQVACDTVMAGPGDRVFLVGSREASLALDNTFVPVDASIVGVVDRLDIERFEGLT
ncbi:MAG: EutN/CcmL family microcompartment protein [Myxococcales bacterium]|nr:EutN/CcmL family microcompartment protein [Myxococcales bacterium]